MARLDTTLKIVFVSARRLIIFQCVLLAASLAWGRGGGGCLEEGTLIATPAGQIPIEQLARGDVVWAVVAGELQSATVEATVEVEPDDYVEITAGRTALRATGEHPFQIGPGIFRAAASLQPGDTLCLRETNAFKTVQITAVIHVPAERPASTFWSCRVEHISPMMSWCITRDVSCRTRRFARRCTPSPSAKSYRRRIARVYHQRGNCSHDRARGNYPQSGRIRRCGNGADHLAGDARASVLRGRRNVQNAGGIEGWRHGFCPVGAWDCASSESPVWKPCSRRRGFTICRPTRRTLISPAASRCITRAVAEVEAAPIAAAAPMAAVAPTVAADRRRRHE